MILCYCLDRLATRILEDLFAVTKIDFELFSTIIDFMFASDANHIQYWAGVKSEVLTDFKNIGVLPPGIPYRTIVCGFWDRKFLIQLLVDGESPWNFEIMGSYRASYSDQIYALRRPLFEHINIVEKGCWIPKSVAWAKEQRIKLSIGSRPFPSRLKSIAMYAQLIYCKCILKISWRLRVRAMNLLRRLLVSY